MNPPPPHWLQSCLAIFAFTHTIGSADDLPRGVVNTQNPNDISLTPEESLARITVPEGFTVTLFAGEPDLRRPIAFDIDDRGRLWVVENYSHPNWSKDNATDRIIILEDTDQDGRFDKRTVFWDQGRYLTGIAWGHGGVWIANTPELAFIPDQNHDDIPDQAPIIKLDGFRVSTNNVVNNFHWGPDGWLYGAIGLSSRSLIGPPGTPEEKRQSITRGIWRYHPLQERFEVVAEGMVNPWGADFNQYGDLFTSNTVIAHLFHIVPGMKCQRRDRESSHPHVYEQIQSITDHLHWGGGVWQSSRQTTEAHSVAGGGHAHCGAMIYLGDNWPTQYHGKFFTNNLHGNRINMDSLEPRQSGYVGIHGEDFLFANDPWFRGMSLKYGPDGGVYVSDWHDYGECHDSDGSHRTTGRIYKVVHGRPNKAPEDLNSLTSPALAALHEHPNEWIVRHARRILQERAARGAKLQETEARLRKILEKAPKIEDQLRAFWSLHVIDRLDESELISGLNHPNPHLRRWSVRFLSEHHNPSQRATEALIQMSHEEPSAKVRLELASTLQRIPPAATRRLAHSLLQRSEDANDSYIPLMIWYGIEPIIQEDPSTAIQLAEASKISKVREFLVRRALSRPKPNIDHVLRAIARQDDAAMTRDFLAGALDALQGQAGIESPRSWQDVYPYLSQHKDSEIRPLAVRLAILFGDPKAIDDLQQSIRATNKPLPERRHAFQSLLKIDSGLPVALLHELITEASPLRSAAIQALLTHNEPSSAQVILDHYAALSPAERQDGLAVLATRSTFASALLDAIENGMIQRNDVSAFVLQQLRSFKNTALKSRVERLWSDAKIALEKSEEIAHYKSLLTNAYLENGNAAHGRQLFDQTCATCHTLFGEGSNVGPDLTGSGRAELDYILSNLIDPNAVIDDAYRLTTLDLKDGRVLSGFMEQLGDRFLIFKTPQGSIRLPMSDVESIQTSSVSMMPEGMLGAFSDTQIRDLILYLKSPTQVSLPGTE